MSDILKNVVAFMEATERSDEWKALEKEIDGKLPVTFKDEINAYLDEHTPSSVWTPKDMLINRKNNNWGIPNRNLIAFADDGKGNAVCYDIDNASYKYWDGANFSYDDIGTSINDVLGKGYIDGWDTNQASSLAQTMDTTLPEDNTVIEAADDDDDETLTVKDADDDTLTVKGEENKSSLREDGIDLDDDDIDDDAEEGPAYRRKSTKKSKAKEESDDETSTEDTDDESEDDVDDTTDDDTSDTDEDTPSDETSTEDTDDEDDTSDDADDTSGESEAEISVTNEEEEVEVTDTETPNDDKDIKYLNKLIASEMSAVNEYLKGALDTDDPNLKRLYSDIGMEERFHAEQLTYAKSLKTGEKYTPRDRKVKQEYIELNGDPENEMDEEETLEAAIDKARIKYSVEALMLEEAEYYDEAFYDEIESINEQITVFEMMFHIVSHQERIIAESANGFKTLQLYDENEEPILETVYNTERHAKSIDNAGKKIKSFSDLNPVSIFASLWFTVFKFGMKIIDAIKHTIDSIGTKISEFSSFIHAHGIKGLFQSGFKLYFYSEEEAGPDPELFSYIIFLNKVSHAICRYTKIADRVKPEEIEVDLSKYDDVKSFKGYRKINWKTSALSKLWYTRSTDLSDLKTKFSEDDLNRAMAQIDNIKLIKTKVVVTKENEKEIARYFFGYNGDKIKGTNKSFNIYNVFAELKNELHTYMGNAKIMFSIFQDECEKPDSYLGKNPVIRQKGTEYFTKTINAFKIFLNALASDMNSMSKLTKLMREQKKAADTQDKQDAEEAEGLDENK